jgi:hypothetical protein
VHAGIELETDRRTARLALTDYKHRLQFVPGIRSVRVPARVVGGSTERRPLEQASR